jgi:hypothetical protein
MNKGMATEQEMKAMHLNIMEMKNRMSVIKK